MNSTNRKLLLFYTVVFIIFLFIAIPGSVIQGDDFYYTMVCYTADFFNISNDAPEKMPAKNLWHVLVTQYYGYKMCNGRFIVHALTQLFTIYSAYKAIIVVKAILGMLIVLLLGKICINSENKNITPRLIICACLLIIMPLFAFGEYFSGNAITFNYGLSSCASLLAIYMFLKSFCNTGRVKKIKAVSMICVAILLGCLHEGFSVPILASMMIYGFIKRRQLTHATWIFVIGYAIGTLATVASPGIWGRFLYESGHGDMPVADILKLKWTAATYYTGHVLYSVLVLICIFVLLQLNKKYRTTSRIVMRKNIFFLILAVSTYLFAFASGILYTRPYALMGYSMVIICSQLIFIPLSGSAMIKTRRAVAVASAIAIVAITSVAFAGGMTRLDKYKEAMSQYKTTGTVILEDEYERNYSCWSLHLGPYAIHPTGSPWVSDMVAYYCSDSHTPIKFMPKGDFANPANLIFQNDSLKVYHRPESWWIAIEGGDFTDKKFRSVTMELFSDNIVDSNGRNLTLVARSISDGEDEITAVDSLGYKTFRILLP